MSYNTGIDSDYRKVYYECMSSPTIQEAIEQYLAEYLTARNLAPLTRINYASDLKQLTRYLTERAAARRPSTRCSRATWTGIW